MENGREIWDLESEVSMQVRITEDKCSTTSENRLDFEGVHDVSWHKDVTERAEDCSFVLCKAERK
jgi:hypothetical protein